jgi:hypothetical protein
VRGGIQERRSGSGSDHGGGGETVRLSSMMMGDSVGSWHGVHRQCEVFGWDFDFILEETEDVGLLSRSLFGLILT